MNQRLMKVAMICALTAASGCLYHYRSVDVLVQDADTKLPIANAKVNFHYTPRMLSSWPQQSTGQTDEQGRVKLKVVPEVFPTLDIDAPNYDQHRSPLGFKVTKPGNKSDFELVLPIFGKEGPTVELVAPVGFRGLVKIEIHPLPEKDWVPNQRIFTAAVPKGGIVEIKGPTPLFDWRFSSTEYKARFAVMSTASTIVMCTSKINHQPMIDC